jgi:hypothetical protein
MNENIFDDYKIIDIRIDKKGVVRACLLDEVDDLLISGTLEYIFKRLQEMSDENLNIKKM